MFLLRESQLYVKDNPLYSDFLTVSVLAKPKRFLGVRQVHHATGDATQLCFLWMPAGKHN